MIINISNKIETVVAPISLLGEGPVWDAKTGTIFWLDILNGELHSFGTRANTYRCLSVGQMIGCISIASNGNFIAGLKSGIGFIDHKTGKVDILVSPEKDLPNNRFNDGKCDRAGRFWAGTMSLSEEDNAGNLYMLDTDGEIFMRLQGVTISNGMAWSADDKIFYYIDTPTCQVWAYDFDLNTGHISNKKIIIQIPKDEGFPDGMTIDKEGMLWIAHWDGWKVSRWDPSRGKKLLEIKLPVARVTSCTFGGEQFNDLYITTAKIDVNEQELSMQPLAGSLFVVRDLPFSGLPLHEYQYRG